MYKKILILSGLIVNTGFFMSAASDQSNTKIDSALTHRGLPHVPSSSYTLCAAAASASAAVPAKSSEKPSRKMSLSELYPVANGLLASHTAATTTEALSQYSASTQRSEETDAHYKQHASDAATTNDPESGTLSHSTSFSSTVENPLDLYGG